MHTGNDDGDDDEDNINAKQHAPLPTSTSLGAQCIHDEPASVSSDMKNYCRCALHNFASLETELMRKKAM